MDRNLMRPKRWYPGRASSPLHSLDIGNSRLIVLCPAVRLPNLLWSQKCNITEGRISLMAGTSSSLLLRGLTTETSTRSRVRVLSLVTVFARWTGSSWLRLSLLFAPQSANESTEMDAYISSRARCLVDAMDGAWPHQGGRR